MIYAEKFLWLTYQKLDWPNNVWWNFQNWGGQLPPLPLSWLRAWIPDSRRPGLNLRYPKFRSENLCPEKLVIPMIPDAGNSQVVSYKVGLHHVSFEGDFRTLLNKVKCKKLWFLRAGVTKISGYLIDLKYRLGFARLISLLSTPYLSCFFVCPRKHTFNPKTLTNTALICPSLTNIAASGR